MKRGMYMGLTTTEFMDLCKKFETLFRDKYNYTKTRPGPFTVFCETETYRSYWKDMRSIANIRNVIAHSDLDVDGDEGIVVAERTMRVLKDVIELLENPPLVEDVFIRNMKYVKIEDSVSQTIAYMTRHSITHMPVLDKTRNLIGVFSENTIFTRLDREEIVAIDVAETLESYRDYLPIDCHKGEYFGFIGLQETLETAKDLFNQRNEEGKRLVLLYVTKTGRKDQPVLGVLSPYDLI